MARVVLAGLGGKTLPVEWGPVKVGGTDPWNIRRRCSDRYPAWLLALFVWARRWVPTVRRSPGDRGSLISYVIAGGTRISALIHAGSSITVTSPDAGSFARTRMAPSVPCWSQRSLPGGFARETRTARSPGSPSKSSRAGARHLVARPSAAVYGGAGGSPSRPASTGRGQREGVAGHPGQQRVVRAGADPDVTVLPGCDEKGVRGPAQRGQRLAEVDPVLRVDRGGLAVPDRSVPGRARGAVSDVHDRARTDVCLRIRRRHSTRRPDRPAGMAADRPRPRTVVELTCCPRPGAWSRLSEDWGIPQSGVGKGGVEPPRPFGHTDLNRARLPFRHLPWRALRLAAGGRCPGGGSVVALSTPTSPGPMSGPTGRRELPAGQRRGARLRSRVAQT